MKKYGTKIINTFDIWDPEVAFVKDFTVDNNSILRGKIKKTGSNKFHNKMPKGAILRELSKDNLHQINWETPHFEELIKKYLVGTDLSLPILDLGTGDGRFVKTLVDIGFEKIVCLDSDYRLLESLHTYSEKEGFRKKLCIIHSDADEINFRQESFGAVLAIGILYYLNKRRKKTLSLINSILIKDGVFILSEPEIESILFRSLIFESLSSTIEVFQDRVFKEGKEEDGFKFSVQSKRELIYELKKMGFRIDETNGITFFHNLLRILFVRGLIEEDELISNIKKVKKLGDFLQNEGTFSKQIVLKCRKGT